MDDVDQYIRFIEYLKHSMPDVSVSVKRIASGFHISVQSNDSQYESQFGSTIIVDKDARRRCVEKLQLGLVGLAQEIAKVGISKDGLNIELSPRLSQKSKLIDGSRVDLRLGTGADTGWIQIINSEASHTKIHANRTGTRCSFKSTEYDLSQYPIKRLGITEFRVSTGSVSIRLI